MVNTLTPLANAKKNTINHIVASCLVEVTFPEREASIASALDPTSSFGRTHGRLRPLARAQLQRLRVKSLRQRVVDLEPLLGHSSDFSREAIADSLTRAATAARSAVERRTSAAGRIGTRPCQRKRKGRDGASPARPLLARQQWTVPTRPDCCMCLFYRTPGQCSTLACSSSLQPCPRLLPITAANAAVPAGGFCLPSLRIRAISVGLNN
jgi:hypothetical protein